MQKDFRKEPLEGGVTGMGNTPVRERMLKDGGGLREGAGMPMQEGLGIQDLNGMIAGGVPEFMERPTMGAEEAIREEMPPNGMTEYGEGTKGIGREEVSHAIEVLQKYKEGKQHLEQRLIENEKWYRVRQWDVIGHSENGGDPEPSSAWLFNSLANKHADAMDNIPTLSVLPREEGDRQDAKTLSGVLPAVMDAINFEQTYSDMWWYKLRSGTGVLEVVWDSEAMQGIGEIAIKSVDLINLFWEPGITNIQDSRHIFHVQMMDRETVREAWPEWHDAKSAGKGTIDLAEYAHDDSIDLTDKVLVVDWYYKKQNSMGDSVLHYCKFCGEEVLFASENEEEYRERGYYDHGLYPFELDVLFPMPDTPVGSGYIDMCKDCQIYIDKLDQAILKNTVMGARPRYWLRNDANVSVEEYADLSNDFVHFVGNGNPEESIYPISIPQFNKYSLTIRDAKINEMKETSGNRDFSQGGSSGGVTAASAVAALQEAGSKLSRDMIKSSYRTFARVGQLCIELIRQFYTEPRIFRIIGENGGMEFAEFSGQSIQQKTTGDGFLQGTRVPYFDIKVIAEKSSPFSTVAQNERAKELYGLGFFRPDLSDQALAALDMMQFEGIEKVRQRITENGTMAQRVEQLTQLSLALAQQVDASTGSSFAQQVAMIAQQGGAQAGGDVNVTKGMIQEDEANSLGDSFNQAKSKYAGEARKRAANASNPGVSK